MDKVNKVLFIPYFYTGEKGIPLKRILTILMITVPTNSILFYILYKKVWF
jgi:hypothetical protein